MTLTDAGALIALVDKNQPQNARCRSAFLTLSLPLVTTWPAFTEAMYLVYQIGGWLLQRNLWQYVEEADRKFKRPFCAGLSGAHLPEPPPPPAGGHAAPGVCTRTPRAERPHPPERSGVRAGAALRGLDMQLRMQEDRADRCTPERRSREGRFWAGGQLAQQIRLWEKAPTYLKAQERKAAAEARATTPRRTRRRPTAAR